MYTFIVNPIAGNGRPIKSMDKVDEFLNHKHIPFEVVYTKEPEHAIQLARELSQNPKTEAVVAVGGDGTVAEVAAGLLDTDCPMGIIPAGTGNDYRRIHGVPDDAVDAVKTIIAGKKKKTDTVSINGRTYLNIITVGFDVEVVRRAFYYRLFKEASYTLGAIDRAFFAKLSRAEFLIDDKKHEQDFLLFAAGCGAYYGGGMKPIPGADPYDGLLDYCLIDRASTFTILTLLPKFKIGEHTDFDIAHFGRAKHIKITFDKPLSFNADGDILPPVHELEYVINPGNLTVLSGV